MAGVSSPSFAANDLNTGLRELRELAEKAGKAQAEGEWKWYVNAFPNDLYAFIAACSPSLLLALTEVVAKAADLLIEDVEAGDLGEPGPGAERPLAAALARLSVCFSGAQPNNEEGCE